MTTSSGIDAHLTNSPINNKAAPPIKMQIRNQIVISGKGTPKVPKKPACLSTVPTLSKPSCQNTKKR